MHPSVDRSAGAERDHAREAIAQKLRELPGELAPPFDWGELQRRSQLRAMRDPRAVGRNRGGAARDPGAARRRSIALAACAALLAAAAALTSRFERGRPERAPPRAQTAQLARLDGRTLAAPDREPAVESAPTRGPASGTPPAPGVGSAPAPLPAPERQALLARADTAERWLASEPEDGTIVRVSTHLAVTSLEDRLASMDDLLNLERLQHADTSRLHALQLQRAQLLDSLAQVRYAEILADEAP